MEAEEKGKEGKGRRRPLRDERERGERRIGVKEREVGGGREKRRKAGWQWRACAWRSGGECVLVERAAVAAEDEHSADGREGQRRSTSVSGSG